MTCEVYGASSGHMPTCMWQGSVRIATARGDLVVSRDGSVSVTGDLGDVLFWSLVYERADELELGAIARLASLFVGTRREVDRLNLERDRLALAIRAIAELPGPHYSAAAKAAVSTAKRALGR